MGLDVLFDFDSNRVIFHAEEMAKNGLSLIDARHFVHSNPVTISESRDLYQDAADSLLKEFGIFIPEYQLIFANGLNPRSFLGTEDARTNWVDRKIILPTMGSLAIPITISHEQGHSYQVENNGLYEKLRSVYDSWDLEKFSELRAHASCLIEWWAVFLSSLYVGIRDNRIGKRFYLEFLDEINKEKLKSDISSRCTEFVPYYQGFRIYQDIAQRHGIKGAFYAANKFRNDQELVRY